jgi:hypothetical protein
LPEGDINFVTEGSGKLPEILPIRDGTFSGRVTPGKKKIQINAYKEGKPLPPDTPGAEAGTPQVNYIPSKYNANSQTFEEINSTGTNEFIFDLFKE